MNLELVKYIFSLGATIWKHLIDSNNRSIKPIIHIRFDRPSQSLHTMGLFQSTVTPNPSIDLSGKVVIVTGGNAGLGHASAQQFLVGKASTLILACRKVSKGGAARLDYSTIRR